MRGNAKGDFVLNFLAIDTSGKYLSVIAYREGETERVFLPSCAMKHSVVLMDEIESVLSRAKLRPENCDFFAAVVGPGSFTGIRIGISTVKGLCFACEKPALSITSFDCLAYAENKRVLALVDAGHGCFYACGYDESKAVVVPPVYCTEREVSSLIAQGFAPVAADSLFEGCAVIDPCEGLLRAAEAKSREMIPASGLTALYLRKSSAEENRK